MRDRSAWTRGQAGAKVIHGKKYKDLTEFHRPCASCGKHFSIFVTERIAIGHADSNSFGLKNCEDHRRSPGNNLTVNADNDGLRMANSVMRQELEGLYRQVAELTLRLAKYELPAAVKAEANKMPWE